MLLNSYKSNFKPNKTYLNFLINNNKYKILYKKNYTVNINMLLNIYKLYSGKYFFKKYINMWSLGYSVGSLVWTKKSAKYKSKLKLKLKVKLLMQKKQKQQQQQLKKNQRNLYNKYSRILIPKPQLKLIKNNIKLR